jgi:hypothetical protein
MIRRVPAQPSENRILAPTGNAEGVQPCNPFLSLQKRLDLDVRLRKMGYRANQTSHPQTDTSPASFYWAGHILGYYPNNRHVEKAGMNMGVGGRGGYMVYF